VFISFFQLKNPILPQSTQNDNESFMNNSPIIYSSYLWANSHGNKRFTIIYNNNIGPEGPFMATQRWQPKGPFILPFWQHTYGSFLLCYTQMLFRTRVFIYELISH